MYRTRTEKPLNARTKKEKENRRNFEQAKIVADEKKAVHIS